MKLYPVIGGTIIHISGRTLSLNDLIVDVPRKGSVNIGVEISASGLAVGPSLCRLTGPSSRRYSIMQIGDEQLRNIVAESKKADVAGISFGYAHPRPRIQVSVN